MSVTRRIVEHVGAHVFELHTLADLDAAVDEVLFRGGPEGELCPYFGVVWPSARAVAAELAREGAELRGRTVLELGCGLALPSLLAARLGASVTATDAHPEVPAFLARNLAACGLAGDAIAYRELDWRTGGLGRTFDLVVASDVLYEAGQPEPVARAFANHVAPGGRGILADPARTHLQACVDLLAAAGFAVETEVVGVADPLLDRAGDGETREVFVLRLAR